MSKFKQFDWLYSDSTSADQIRVKLLVRMGRPCSPEEFASLIDLLKGKAELSFLRAKGLQLEIGELSPEHFAELSQKLSHDQYASFAKAYQVAPVLEMKYPPKPFSEAQQNKQHALAPIIPSRL